jgi:preflagellin peptidase FlaK
MEAILYWTRIALSLGFLTYASWSDFKTREVSNNVWVAFAPAAFVLTFTQFLFYPPTPDALSSMIYFGTSFAVTSVFSTVLFYAGAFGGADAKALMCIALATPIPESFLEPLSSFVSFIFPITIFSNAVIIAALSVIYALTKNLIWKVRTRSSLFDGYENMSFGNKAIILLSGYKVPIVDLEESFMYPLEDVYVDQEGETQRRLVLFPKDGNREETIERIIKAKNESPDRDLAWATPGLPMLIFITLGLVISLILGDLIWIILRGVLA